VKKRPTQCKRGGFSKNAKPHIKSRLLAKIVGANSYYHQQTI
jgi:hypothetical protein